MILKTTIIIITFLFINFICINSTITVNIDCKNLVDNNIISDSDNNNNIIINLINDECKGYHITEIINKYLNSTNNNNNNNITINGNSTNGCTTIFQSKRKAFINLNDNLNQTTTSVPPPQINITITNIQFKNWLNSIIILNDNNNDDNINNINFINTTFYNQSSNIIMSTSSSSNNNDNNSNITDTLENDENNKIKNSITFLNCNFSTIQTQSNSPIYLFKTSLSIINSEITNSITTNQSFIHLKDSILSIENSNTFNVLSTNQSFITLINTPSIISNYSHHNNNGSFINHINFDFLNHMTIQFSQFINNIILPINYNNNNNNNNNDLNGFIILDGENPLHKDNVLLLENSFINFTSTHNQVVGDGSSGVSSSEYEDYSIINVKNINLIMKNNTIINCSDNLGDLNQNTIYLVGSNLTLENSEIQSNNPIKGYGSTVFIDDCSNKKIGTNDNDKSIWCVQCQDCLFEIQSDNNKTLTNSELCPSTDETNTNKKKNEKGTLFLVISLVTTAIIATGLVIFVVVKRNRNSPTQFDYLKINQYYLDDEEEKRDLLLLNSNVNYNNRFSIES